jgi:FolB domain-containing protein
MRISDGHQVHIEQLKILGRVGVSKAERAKRQRLIVNLTFWPVRGLRDLNDDVRRTVDYFAVSEETKKFVWEQSPKLIETLADRIATQLLRTFAIGKITVELRKFVLADAAYVSVTVTRRARVD